MPALFTRLSRCPSALALQSTGRELLTVLKFPFRVCTPTYRWGSLRPQAGVSYSVHLEAKNLGAGGLAASLQVSGLRYGLPRHSRRKSRSPWIGARWLTMMSRRTRGTSHAVSREFW
jgi:hypothetical protein